MTNEEKLHKEDVINRLNRLSKHYALTDDQKELIRDAAEIIHKDIKEIVGMMAISKEMMRDLGEQRVGEICMKVLGRR